MISFSSLDIIIILAFFLILLIVGMVVNAKSNSAEEFLLSNRSLGLFLFVMTNVSTWYGGILGVGEFTYRYGILSWVTQGLPYYFFAILFALLIAKKVRAASLFTIPDKLETVYGSKVARVATLLVFLLVSPAPYLLMVGNLFSIMFGVHLIWGLVLGLVLSLSYLLKSGYKSDIYTDVFQFFVMFIGFAVALLVTVINYGGFRYLEENIPANHLTLTGGTSPFYILVWFLISLWTFADPGFHQRCNAAKNGNVAKWGIVISVAFWALFDFLTTSTGLYARALLPNLDNPVNAFPLFGDKVLTSGVKGLFFAAMFATILSTLNSFVFLSATTFGHDFLSKVKISSKKNSTISYTRIGLIVTSVLALVMSLYFQSIIQIWYLIGSVCIPGLILLIFGAYYPKLQIDKNIALVELISATLFSIGWYILREYGLLNSTLAQIEPMLVGLTVSIAIHLWGIIKKSS